MAFFDIFKKKQDTPPTGEQAQKQQEELSAGLEKTKTGLFSKLARAVAGRSTIDAGVLDDLEEVLISSDVGVETTVKIIRRIEERVARDKYMNASELQSILRGEIATLMEDAHGSSENFGLDAAEGQPYVVMVVGVNGAGKTTTLQTISGLLHPKMGSVLFEDHDLKGVAPHKIVEHGLAQVPEGRHIFQQMTVEENLQMGAYTQPNSTIEPGIADVYERFPRLKERRRQIAGTLSGGEQQMLAMGRALMSKPKLLMLDEPSMGLAPILVEQIFDIIRELHAAGTTILLVEQNAQAALSVADRAYVLETGRISLTGTGAELMASDAVRKAYLGG